MKLLLPFLLLPFLLLSSCKTNCADPGSVASLMTGAVVKGLNCTNSAQVLADMTKVAASANLCTETPAPGTKGGPFAGLLCPVIVGKIVDLGAGQLPASWQCHPTSLEGGATAALTALCNLLPF